MGAFLCGHNPLLLNLPVGKIIMRGIENLHHNNTNSPRMAYTPSLSLIAFDKVILMGLPRGIHLRSIASNWNHRTDNSWYWAAADGAYCASFCSTLFEGQSPVKLPIWALELTNKETKGVKRIRNSNWNWKGLAQAILRNRTIPINLVSWPVERMSQHKRREAEENGKGYIPAWPFKYWAPDTKVEFLNMLVTLLADQCFTSPVIGDR
ncbi:hypothetical protein ACJX0J_041870, partial [Zea mays]